MFKIRELTQESEYKEYQEKYFESIGEKFASKTEKASLDYFEKSYVIGVFNQDNIMVAGYTLGLSSPYRLPHFVPQGSTLQLPADGFNWDQCCEIVCLWKNKNKVPKHYMLRYLWPQIFKDFLNSDKKYVLGHDQNENLDKHYSFLGPKTLYFGESTTGLPSRLFIYGRYKIILIRAFSLLLSVRHYFDKNFK